MNEITGLLYTPRSRWNKEEVRRSFNDALQRCYPRVADLLPDRNEERRFQLRVNANTSDGSVPFAALIAPEQPTSGPYGGMSLVVFPADDDSPCLLALVVGTNGLAPDEAILGRPGHARKCEAIADWARTQGLCAFSWAKRDPTRIDLALPDACRAQWLAWSGAIRNYGHVIYAAFSPPEPSARDNASDTRLERLVTALVDLFFDERGIEARTAHRPVAGQVRAQWLARLLPSRGIREVTALLEARRFAIVEGPPGTGKTRLALKVLEERYGGSGKVIQFHPGTSYESFVGGLGPVEGTGRGLEFQPRPGHLMRAIAEAREQPGRRFLLVIDEINRADLSKVLGEAIFLFEPGEARREIELAYDFPGNGRMLSLPDNFDVLGTMNSADRSIAILDVAVRRRFAFTVLPPQPDVVAAKAGPRMRDAFDQLLRIFVEHAAPDAMALMPGHAYFLGSDEEAALRLDTGVRPLLEEYLAQGYVAGFADEIRAYLDMLPAAA